MSKSHPQLPVHFLAPLIVVSPVYLAPVFRPDGWLQVPQAGIPASACPPAPSHLQVPVTTSPLSLPSWFQASHPLLPPARLPAGPLTSNLTSSSLVAS